MNNLKIVALLGFLILAVLSPLALVWALNTLFPPLNIPYTLQTWLACMIIYGVFQVRVRRE